jgi:hypothetical protein
VQPWWRWLGRCGVEEDVVLRVETLEELAGAARVANSVRRHGWWWRSSGSPGGALGLARLRLEENSGEEGVCCLKGALKGEVGVELEAARGFDTRQWPGAAVTCGTVAGGVGERERGLGLPCGPVVREVVDKRAG